MAFHFTLDGLLRLRESLEKAELQRLQFIAGEISVTREEIESLEEAMDAAHRRASNRVVDYGLTGAELHFEIVRESAWAALRSQMLKKLSDLEQKWKEQHSRYLHAHMQREIVLNLYKRQFADYRLEESRRAQKRIDELFLIRGIPAARQFDTASDDEPS